MPEPRIGVFVCHCGRNIGGYVNVPEVVEYVKGLPDVVHAEHNLYTCSEVGITAIKKAIPEHRLNRVIVASCTPRTHEPLFRSACEEAGLNKYLFEFVNIRDQCSWVHMTRPKEATEKAKTLVRMGVARARLLESFTEIELKVTPAALIIGGGIAGMTAALSLANQGFAVHLVEKGDRLGGTLLGLHTLFTGDTPAAQLVEPVAARVNQHGKIKVHLATTVQDVAGFIGNFQVTLAGPGAADKLDIGAIIVATGAEELKPDGQYGYGAVKGVLTELELEQRLQKGPVSTGNAVFINCVGARVPERTYCSRFCCTTSLKNARLLKEQNPAAKVWVLHRDIMAFGVEYEDYYRRAMAAGVRFIRYSPEQPPRVIGDGAVTGLRVYHPLLRKEVSLPADTLVLTTPLVAGPDNEAMSRMLKVPLGQDGFFLETHPKLRPVEFATDGIYLCGAARWPTEVAEAISQAYGASAKAAAPLRTGHIKPEAVTSAVRRDVCTTCGVCVEVCPYNAMEMTVERGKRAANTIKALCKGCGTCAAACRCGAITINHFNNAQIVAQIEALVGR